jgi:hypothetical protein
MKWMLGLLRRQEKIELGRLPEIEDTSEEKPQETKIAITEEELRRIKALGGCTFRVASYEKRFIRDMQSQKLGDELTIKQFKLINRLFWMYRKQHGLPMQKVE